MAFLSRVFADTAVFRSTVNLRCIQRLSIPATHIKTSSQLTPNTDEVLTPRELEVAEAVLTRMKESKQSLEDSPRAPEPEPVVLRPRKWTRISRRTGVLSKKLGMTQLWKKDGTSVAVTVVQIVDNQVVMVRTRMKEGYYGLQVGAVNHPKVKNVTKPVLGQYLRAEVPPKRKLMEFRVTHDALLPVGTHLDVSHFTPGQYVDVCSTSIGKGFQGVMKRHGMKGMPASHGVTKSHRKMGGTGGGQDPGRIWPGKKMAGHMGNKRVTTQSLKVYRVNYKYNVLYIHGPIPGHKNAFVRVTDARRKTPPYASPFPGYIPPKDQSDIRPTEEAYSDDIHLPYEATLEFPDKRKLGKSK